MSARLELGGVTRCCISEVPEPAEVGHYHPCAGGGRREDGHGLVLIQRPDGLAWVAAWIVDTLNRRPIERSA